MFSIRVVLGLVVSMDMEVKQLDVKIAFLDDDLEDEIYMEQSKGFKERDKVDHVCKIKKCLYGLKQAPQKWYESLNPLC